MVQQGVQSVPFGAMPAILARFLHESVLDEAILATRYRESILIKKVLELRDPGDGPLHPAPLRFTFAGGLGIPKVCTVLNVGLDTVNPLCQHLVPLDRHIQVSGAPDKV